MKKGICFLLVFSLLLMLTACKPDSAQPSNDEGSIDKEITFSSKTTDNQDVQGDKPSSDNKKTAVKTKAVTKPQTESVTVPDEPTEEETCRTVLKDEWEKIRITDTDKTLSFVLELPDDWRVQKVDKDTFAIFRSNKKIGTIERDQSLSRYQDFEYGNIADITAQTSYRVMEDDGHYYRYFVIEFVQNTVKYTVYVTVDYNELDEKSCREFIRKLTLVPQKKVFIHPSEGNGSNKILILGNSFVATSEVGEFLNDMLRTSGLRYYADPIAIGMANVTTFENYPDICDSMANGEYCYVFLCGLYSDEAVRAVQTMKNYCELSDTKLILFPAHNESANSIRKATDAYADLIMLNWKGEIDALLERGAEYSDYCVDDYHKHSKPLAGYVGAHMIYRSLFKNQPPPLTAAAPLTERYVNSKLEDYIESGGVIPGYNDQVEEEIKEVFFG